MFGVETGVSSNTCTKRRQHHAGGDQQTDRMRPGPDGQMKSLAGVMSSDGQVAVRPLESDGLRRAVEEGQLSAGTELLPSFCSLPLYFSQNPCLRVELLLSVFLHGLWLL